MKAILVNTEGISNGVHYAISDVCYKDRLESESADGIIPKGTKSGSLRHNDTYKGC